MTHPTVGTDRVDALRRIVAEGQYAQVDGVRVDLFTASAILTVYDALSASNRARYAAFPVLTMARLAFRLASDARWAHRSGR